MQDTIENNLRAGHELRVWWEESDFWASMMIDSHEFLGIGRTPEEAIEDIAQDIDDGVSWEEPPMTADDRAYYAAVDAEMLDRVYREDN